MIVVSRIVVDLRYLGLGDLVRVNTTDAAALSVYLQHDAYRFLSVHSKKVFEYVNNELHRSVVVVQQDDPEQRRFLDPWLGFLDGQSLVIVRPGAEGFNQAALLALASVGFCTVRDLATRRIPKDLPTVFITLLTTVTVTTAGAAVLVPLGGWRPPSAAASMRREPSSRPA